MSHPHFHTCQEIDSVIRKVADIPTRVDDGFILADGIVLYKADYDPATGNYELLVRDHKTNRWKSFSSEGNPDFIEDAARCFVEFYNARHQGDGTANLDKSYAEIRNSQKSLVSLVESVPGVTVTVLPVTTVRPCKIDTELTVSRNGQELQVFECFFPARDSKYMCGIHMGHEQDGTPVRKSLRSRREFLPGLIRKYTDAKPEPVPEQDINRLKYLMSGINSILAKHGASLDAVPGGLRLRTGEPGHGTVALNLVDREVQ
jgi:hypothetical protein